MPPLLDIVGQKFGKLIVLSRTQNSTTGFSRWKCKCDCGAIKIIRGTNLIHGYSRSCGCLQKEIAVKLGKQQSKKNIIPYSKTVEYSAWRHMKIRCSPANTACKKDYFDRGIRVCDEWVKKDTGFLNFLQHIGKKPTPAHSVDRIDNNRGYEVGNVRWATKLEQMQNRRKYGNLSSFTDEEIKQEYNKRFKRDNS